MSSAVVPGLKNSTQSDGCESISLMRISPSVSGTSGAVKTFAVPFVDSVVSAQPARSAVTP